MAVDSNVLIFERIREEMRLGKTAPRGHRRGIYKAFLTIWIPCHHLIAALFLFAFGTGR
jgi:preprotein translocase subunit SecD